MSDVAVSLLSVWYSRPDCLLRGVYSDTTQLNSTELNWPSWTAYSQVSCVFVYDVTTYTNWVNCCSRCECVDNSTSSWVQLRSVELCRYKPAFTVCPLQSVTVRTVYVTIRVDWLIPVRRDICCTPYNYMLNWIKWSFFFKGHQQALRQFVQIHWK